MLVRLAPLVSLMLVAPAAAAQTVPSATQREYNDKGVQHMFDGEYADAAANFQSSLALGESNIGWLNYGRAMFKLQRCEEAREAYEQVPGAPTVDAPSPEEVAVVLDKFSEEWGSTCTGRLTLECPDDPARVRIDGGAPFVCHTREIAVVPGTHEVEHVEWGESYTVEVSDEPVLVSFMRSVPPPTEGTSDEGQPISELQYAQSIGDGMGTRRMLGLAVMSAGLATLATSGVLELAWVQPRFDAYREAETGPDWDEARERARSAQRTNRVLFFGGLGAAAIGGTLFAIPRSKSGVALNVGPGTISAEVKW